MRTFFQKVGGVAKEEDMSDEDHDNIDQVCAEKVLFNGFWFYGSW